MKTDLQINQEAQLKPIAEIAGKLDIPESALHYYGRNIAKIDRNYLDSLKDRPNGKLILVTATTPTPAGEGKTTVTVGLSQALAILKEKVMVCLREPSLGPCFGIKGGAAGGGYAQVVPMQDINLHFTGDIHAISAAHNLLSAMVDNHIHHGNRLNLDPRAITWRRVVDINDRALRNIVLGLGARTDGVPRESGFDISVASEVMAIFCLSSSLVELKERLGRIVVGTNMEGNPVTASDLNAHGAMAVLLKDALNPNLVQTLEHVPAFVHGGPFANIAHGTNTMIATKAALKLADIVITEAGFASDLGAEKFFNIVSRQAGLDPAAVVLVTTIRSLKYQGGIAREDLNKEDLDAIRRGATNLEAHIDNLVAFNLPVLVSINRFTTDTQAELELVQQIARAKGVKAEITDIFVQGGKGGIDLANALLETLKEEPRHFKVRYPLEMPIKEKIDIIARTVYGADGVDFTDAASREIAALEKTGFGNLPVCIAKTQMSLTDNPAIKARPKGFRVTVRQVRLSAGAGFVVAISGTIMTMPGLPKVPAAEHIDVSDQGEVTGLF